MYRGVATVEVVACQPLECDVQATSLNLYMTVADAKVLQPNQIARSLYFVLERFTTALCMRW